MAKIHFASVLVLAICLLFTTYRVDASTTALQDGIRRTESFTQHNTNSSREIVKIQKRGILRSAYAVGAGAVHAVTSTIEAFYTIIRHPIQFARNINLIFQDPGYSLKGLERSFREGCRDKMRCVGELALYIIVAVMTAGSSAGASGGSAGTSAASAVASSAGKAVVAADAASSAAKAGAIVSAAGEAGAAIAAGSSGAAAAVTAETAKSVGFLTKSAKFVAKTASDRLLDVVKNPFYMRSAVAG